jgi:hypothetical protein
MGTTKGTGSSLHFGNQSDYATSTTWTKLAAVVELTPPVIESESIDTTNMDSPSNFAEKDAGEASVSDIEATIQYEKARNSDVLDLFRVKKGWKLMFSDGSHWGVTAHISSLGNEVERKGIVTLKLKLAVTGIPVFVEAA